MQSKIKYSFQVEKNFIGNLHTNHSQCFYVATNESDTKENVWYYAC